MSFLDYKFSVPELVKNKIERQLFKTKISNYFLKYAVNQRKNVKSEFESKIPLRLKILPH